MDQGADTEVADASGHKAIDYATAHGLRGSGRPTLVRE